MTFDRTFQVRLGRNMRGARLRAGLTQTQVGERLLPPVSYATVASWELGTRALTVVRLADYCRVVGQPLESVAPVQNAPVQVIYAPRLLQLTDSRLRPLLDWAESYGNELIRLTPDTIAQAAGICGVQPDWLQRRLLKVQRT